MKYLTKYNEFVEKKSEDDTLGFVNNKDLDSNEMEEDSFVNNNGVIYIKDWNKY